MGKLVIIDGHAIMHRAFHAIPPLTTPNGEPINAVHGFVSMLLKIVQDVKPTSIVVAFDEKAPTFRQKELPTYQAQRPPMAGELSSQFAKVKEFLKAAKIPVYSMPGYEADDVIGTIATKYTVQSTEYKEAIVVTGDRDQLQLVDDKLGIKLLMPIAGLINAKLFGEAETIERMEVPPNQIVDLKALTGDPSDNYFGVPGIGPKTAVTLLIKYGNLKNIYDHTNEISESVKAKLINGRKSADQSYMLATIVRDVPIEINFDDMSKWNITNPDVVKLFEEDFGFRTLTKRVQDVGRKIEESKQGALF
jgi:DNA polymerase-1